MSETGTDDLSSLLTRLNAFCTETSADGTPVRPPTAGEAMAVYTVAVQLVQTQLDVPDADLENSRAVLLGTRRMLNAALERVEATAVRPRFQVIKGGRARTWPRPGRAG